MKQLELSSRINAMSWCDEIEESAMTQIEDLSRHPCLFKHIAVMPDCHCGYGMPIGGVIACKDAVIPNAVGVDIGCGMSYAETDFPANMITPDKIKEILGYVRALVPVGFKHHEEAQEWAGFDNAPEIEIIQSNVESARRQLGTLGGGNHFIELQAVDKGEIAVMVHSGSRNFGYRVAKEYNEKAIALCDKWHSDVPNKDLAFLPVDSKEGQEYIEAMNYALRFAYQNRMLMMDRTKSCIRSLLECEFVDELDINVHHNFAALENHYGKNVWVHRKGAVKANKGLMGVIPGSMGTSSYIVKGLGNRESFCSSSHGAGRVMSRSGASKTLTVDECDKAMDGIVFGRWGKARNGKPDLGEAPQAYKDIDAVMESQSDLVEIVSKLRPLGVVKG